MTEKISMPLSVLLAICTELNYYRHSQMAAARMNVDLDAGFVVMLDDLACKIHDEGVKDWILDELHHVEPSEEPEEE